MRDPRSPTEDPEMRRSQNSWSIQGIMSRRSLPTFSTWWPAFLAHAVEVLAAGAVLGDPLLGELARLDLAEDLLHRRPRLLADDPFAAGHVAVLGRVGDRVAHSLDPLLVHQVGDQLQLVQALEVGEARVVAGLDQGLEAGADQLGGAAAEDRLLAEEVGLALVLEGRLDDRGAAAADPGGVGEDEAVGVAGGVLVDGHQAGHAVAFLVLAADQVAGALGRDHADVDAGRRHDLLEVDREAVGEEQQVARRDPVGDLGLPDLGLLLVGQQDHHDVAAAGGFGDVEHLEAGRLGLGAAGGVRAQADDDVDAGVLQVEGVGVALGAVAEDGDGLALEQGEVGVLVVEDVVCAHGRQASGGRAASACPRACAAAPRPARPASAP